MSDPDPSTLLERLGSLDRGTQRGACDEATRRLREEPGLREQILQLMRHGSPQARFAAVFVLFAAEGPTLRLLPPLLEALDLDDGDQRWSAAHMLSLLGRTHGEVLPVVLHEAGAGAAPQRRRMALYVLRELAPERGETRDALLAGLDDPDADVRRAALSSLGKLHDPGPDSLTRVLELLGSDEDARMRRIAAAVLPALIQADPGQLDRARRTLEQSARSADTSLARAAALALRRLPEARA